MLGTERKEYLFNELTKLIGPVGVTREWIRELSMMLYYRSDYLYQTNRQFFFFPIILPREVSLVK